MNSTLEKYVEAQDWPEARGKRLVSGLRVLQEVATRGAEPITYSAFAKLMQPKLASLAAAAVLEDIGVFCQENEWPNVTCFVVSATTGECSDAFTKISKETPKSARDAAWFRYKVYKNAPLVEDA